MRYERPPSEQQREIIEEPHLEVPLKIVAGAGTGKTFVLAHRFVWLILEGGLPADRLLALTFGEKAALEMRTRIRGLLRLNGVPPPPTLWVHTFHSFAARILRENAYATGRDPEPRLITEVTEALYLEGLVEAAFKGEGDAALSLQPAELSELGLERPEDLRRILLRLVREAKGRGMTPEDFLEWSNRLSASFWERVPAADEVWGRSKEEAAEAVWTRLLGVEAGPPPRASEDKSVRNALNDVLKLYFLNLQGSQPPRREEAPKLLHRARQVETKVVTAAMGLYRLYRERLSQESALDFDGQIMQAVELLRADEERLAQEYRCRFEYLLLDEFQDTSPNQLELVRLVARPRPVREGGGGGTYARLLVVGDQKQSIYGWRNARPGNMDDLLPMQGLDAVDGVTVCRPLTESHRLTGPLVKVANRAGQAARPEDPPLQAGNPAPGTVVFPEPWEDGRGARYARQREAEYVADQIARLQEEGRIGDLSEVAVLLRSRSRFRALKVALEQRQLLYQAQGGVGFFEHPLARDVLAWLQVLSDPQQDAYVVRLLSRAPYGLTDRELYLLLSESAEGGRRRRQGAAAEIVQKCWREEDGRDQQERAQLPLAALGAWGERFAHFREIARTCDARQVLEVVWRHCSEHVSLSPSEERATSVVRATFEGVIEQAPGGELAHLDDLVSALDLYLAEDRRELPVADQPAQGAVQVMTIHRAKGLGFEVVFVFGWNDSRSSGFAHDENWGVRGIKVGNEDPKGLICKLLRKVRGTEEDDENLRLAYVALTRAKRYLCVTRAAGKRGPPRYPAEAYFEGVEAVAVEARPHPSSEAARVRPAPPPRPPALPARAPGVLEVSFTQLRRLEQCPRAWLLSRQAPESWASEGRQPTSDSELGTRFHRFVTAHYRGEAPEVPAFLEGLPAPHAARLERLVEGFLASEWRELRGPAELEVPLSLARRVEESLVVVGGVADLVLPATAQVVDFKTDRKMSPALRSDHALQMLIYREALTRGAQVPDCVLVHARPEGLVDLRLTEMELEAQRPRLEGLLRSVVEYARGGPVEPRPGAQCQRCDWRELCRCEDQGP